MSGSTTTAVCTWFVADDAETATYFPQVVGRSDAPEIQAVYWRCVACFYASSLKLNPDRRHVFFTNTDIPSIDGLDLGALLKAWGVEVVRLPIYHRLAPGSVSSWGNQFYIFDVLDYIAGSEGSDRWLILDSDCVFISPIDDLEQAIDRHGVLTYTLGYDQHPIDEAINGLGRNDMARFLAAVGGPVVPTTPYHGGEIFAGTRAEVARVCEVKDRLWKAVIDDDPYAPREEAHLLSIIYALLGYAPDTANPFIRRMWTNFRHNNLRAADETLTIWHLPREKKSGFRLLYDRIVGWTNADMMPTDMPLDRPLYRSLMGVPRRSPTKFARDLTAKLREKIVG